MLVPPGPRCSERGRFVTLYPLTQKRLFISLPPKEIINHELLCPKFDGVRIRSKLLKARLARPSPSRRHTHAKMAGSNSRSISSSEHASSAANIGSAVSSTSSLIGAPPKQHAHPTLPAPPPSRQRRSFDYKYQQRRPCGRLMVKDCFDDVRRDADVGHAGRDRTPNVVNNPAGHAGALIKFALAETPGGGLENPVAIARRLLQEARAQLAPTEQHAPACSWRARLGA